MSSFKDPAKTKAGAKGARDLIDDHADRIMELQEAVDRLALAGGPAAEGELTNFRAIKDAKFVQYEIRALLISSEDD